MKIEIEQYKGQTIEYNDETDKFVCEIDIEDGTKNSKRSSLKELRKEIDAFIKANLEFKKFKLIKQSYTYSSEFKVIIVEGIRTDGKFTCRDEVMEGKSKRYDIVDFEKELNRDYNKYYYYDSEIIKEKKNIEAEETRYGKIIESKEKALISKLKEFNIKDIKDYIDVFAKS